MLCVRYDRAMKKLSVRARLGLIGAILIALIGIAAYVLPMSYRTAIKDTVNTHAVVGEGLHFEIADTPAKQELGLGNRATIEDNYGMLFVFKDKSRHGFWMKDMLAPIDMIWLSDNGTIVLVDHSVNPDTYPHIFYPPVPVKYVLETRAGYARDHAWDVGTVVSLPHPYGK